MSQSVRAECQAVGRLDICFRSERPDRCRYLCLRIHILGSSDVIQAIIPYVPTENPKLGHLVYEMILAHFLGHNRETLLKTIKTWPKDIYDIPSVIVALESELDKAPSSSKAVSRGPDTTILMECLAELLVLDCNSA